MTPEIEILVQILSVLKRHFGRSEGSFLAILGVKKVVFWTFLKLFWICLGYFMGLKRSNVGLFSAPEVDS